MADEEKPLKSAFELAMDRLKKHDVDAGVELIPLSDEQKARIAEIRNLYQARIAEAEVLHDSRVKRIADPAELEALQQAFRRDKERLTSERDAKIHKIRHGEPVK